MTPDTALIWIVVGFSAVAIALTFPFFIWALRSGQFKEDDHVRSLPLTCTEPEREQDALDV